ncbi:hypothetical protein GS883_21765 [Rhodococcus hoagii]|nr:hypothetical protein [Prescottella equi]
MAGRVASFCSEGDLACATPPNATLARTVTNIAGQLHLEQQDPLRTLTDLAGALGGATIRTAADVVNEDVNFKNGRFTVQSSGKTILGRLARTPTLARRHLMRMQMSSAPSSRPASWVCKLA